MHELTERELYQALEYAKSINEDAGSKIMEQFKNEQTTLAQTIFGIFPGAIAEENEEMAYLFMDLCFDVLCVFQKSFGPLPHQTDMDSKIRSKLQDRFVTRVIKDNPQMELVNFMNMAINDFASESPSRVPTIKTTQTMIFIVIRLFGNLYSHTNKTA